MRNRCFWCVGLTWVLIVLLGGVPCALGEDGAGDGGGVTAAKESGSGAPEVFGDSEAPEAGGAEKPKPLERIKWREGKIRLELTGQGGIPSGKEDRIADRYLSATVEYEVPVMSRGAVGLRLMPIFMYHQEHGDAVIGAGAGLAARIYQVKNEQRGFFGEAQGNMVWHHHRFNGNGCNLGFLTGLGVGYKFKKIDLHTILKFEHISNAGLDKDNAGVNSFGLGIGYSFDPFRARKKAKT